MSPRGLRQVRGDEILQFIVDFNGVHHGFVAEQPLGEAQRGISAIGAQLEDALRIDHAHQHLEQASLDVSRAHGGIEQLQVRVVVEPLQHGWLRADVRGDVFLQFLGHGVAHLMMASTARR